jgi:hypothetical protein
MLLGDARVSTDDQILDVQHAALMAAGCTRIFEDRLPTRRASAPGIIGVRRISAMRL